jgi:subtilisin family serine protease
MTKGVAKDVQLVTVKVLGSTGEGVTSDILAGIDYVRGEKQKNPSQPMVANLSVGLGAEGFSEAINSAVNSLVDNGVVVTVAAGNHQSDACKSSPASAGNAITVAASDRQDYIAEFSNYGVCIDVFAPGDLITSNWRYSTKSTNTISGTSTASPHVAGAAALLLEQDRKRSPADIRALIVSAALTNKVQGDLQGAPNLILNTQGIKATSSSSATNTATCSAFLGPCKNKKNCCQGQCRFKSTCFV